MKLLLAGAVLSLTATAAHADENIERMKQLSLKLNERMTETVARMVPEARDYLPKIEWNAAMTEAGKCTLKAYEDRIGSDGVNTLLTRMETLAARDDLTLEAFSIEGQKISPLSETEQAAVERICGMGKAMTAAMMSHPNFPKFTEFMMKAMSNQ